MSGDVGKHSDLQASCMHGLKNDSKKAIGYCRNVVVSQLETYLNCGAQLDGHKRPVTLVQRKANERNPRRLA